MDDIYGGLYFDKKYEIGEPIDFIDISFIIIILIFLIYLWNILGIK